MFRLTRGISRFLIYIGVISVITYSAYIILNKEPPVKHEVDIPKPNLFDQFKQKPHHQFWQEMFTILNQGQPNIDTDKIEVLSTDKNLIKNRQNLLNRASIPADVVNELKTKHKFVLDNLKDLTSTVYTPKSNGIAIVGGGRFSWLAYLSIVSIRETGSKLPIEVVLPKYNDYENELHLCTEVFPALNARCVVVPDVLGPNVMMKWRDKLQSYQFKSLALMTCSFQNVLLLDADNILLKNPDRLFESKLFKDFGMITWPDYWERTFSPVFYDVAGVFVNPNKLARFNRLPFSKPFDITNESEVKFHDLEGAIPELATESGQLLINKATHSKTLLLSLYYNIYGPKIYYRLFSLGEQGEGDKDTFPAAAVVTGQRYYQVKSFIKTLGYMDSNSQFQGVAMSQKDALVDYEKYVNEVEIPLKEKEFSLETQKEFLNEKIEKVFGQESDIPLFAIHCNYPKLDPKSLMERDDLYDKENRVLKHRIYNGFSFNKLASSNGKNVEVPQDFEYIQWKNIKTALCDRKFSFPHFNDMNMEEICELATNQVQKLSKA